MPYIVILRLIALKMTKSDTIIKMINQLNDNGISRYQISKDTGLLQATLSNWYNQKTMRIDDDKYQKLVKYHAKKIKSISKKT